MLKFNFNAFSILKLLRRLSSNENNKTFFEYNTYYQELFIDGDLNRPVDLSKYDENIVVVLDFLVSVGYVITKKENIYQLSYKGSHFKRFCLGTLLKFLICSIAIPILGAYITAILTIQ